MRTAIVGAGVIGIATAVRLRQEGHDVTVFDRLGPGEACSFGNSGAMPRYQVVPMSTPGILYQVPRYLLDPLGPLALKVSHLPKLAPWLVKFVRASAPAAFERNLTAVVRLAEIGYHCWTDLLRETGLTGDVRDNSSITLYRSTAAREKARPLWRRLRELGADVRFVDGAGMREIEPTVPTGYECGVIGGDYRQAIDPHALVRGLAEHFTSLGGSLRRANVAEIRVQDRQSVLLYTDRARETFSNVVVAAGAWSNELLRPLDVSVPLEAARGYHMTFPEFAPRPKHVLLISDMRMSLTPMSGGLRLGGSIEFAGLHSAPNFGRAAAQLSNLKRLYPSMPLENHTTWFGDRPMTPDSLPVIDRCPRHPNVIGAFGHGQYGLTLAAITARVVADLFADRSPIIDLKPLRWDRTF